MRSNSQDKYTQDCSSAIALSANHVFLKCFACSSFRWHFSFEKEVSFLICYANVFGINLISILNGLKSSNNWHFSSKSCLNGMAFHVFLSRISSSVFTCFILWHSSVFVYKYYMPKKCYKKNRRKKAAPKRRIKTAQKNALNRNSRKMFWALAFNQCQCTFETNIHTFESNINDGLMLSGRVDEHLRKLFRWKLNKLQKSTSWQCAKIKRIVKKLSWKDIVAIIEVSFTRITWNDEKQLGKKHAL